MADSLGGEEERFAASLEVEKNEDFFRQVGRILDEINALPPAVYVQWQVDLRGWLHLLLGKGS